MSQSLDCEQNGLSFVLDLWLPAVQVQHWIYLKDFFQERDFVTMKREIESSKVWDMVMPTGSRFEALSCYGYWDRSKGKRSILSHPDADFMIITNNILVIEEEDNSLLSSHINIITESKHSIALAKTGQPTSSWTRTSEASVFLEALTLEANVTRRTNKDQGIFMLYSDDSIHPGFTCMKQYSDHCMSNNKLTFLDNKDMHATTLADDLSAVSFKSHGPALTREEHRYQGLPFDIVTAIPYKFWPRTAFKWIGRIRMSAWPDTKLKFHILNTGCLFVPVGSHTGVSAGKEWRYSFSVAEGLLASNVTLIQRKTYLLFKTLCKFSICKANTCSSTSKNISSYHLKTVFFWCLEDIGRSKWCQQNLSLCICHLLDKLLLFLQNRHLPNYFIPENNMIDHLSDDDYQNILLSTEEVRGNLLKSIVSVDEIIGIGGATIPEIPITVICRPVINFLTSLRNAELLSVSKLNIGVLEAKLKSLSRLGFWWFISANHTGLNYQLLFTEKVFEEFVCKTETIIASSDDADGKELSQFLDIIKQRQTSEASQSCVKISDLDVLQQLLEFIDNVYAALCNRIIDKRLDSSCLWKEQVLIYGGILTLADTEQIIEAYHQVVFGTKTKSSGPQKH